MLASVRNETRTFCLDGGFMLLARTLFCSEVPWIKSLRNGGFQECSDVVMDVGCPSIFPFFGSLLILKNEPGTATDWEKEPSQHASEEVGQSFLVVIFPNQDLNRGGGVR